MKKATKTQLQHDKIHMQNNIAYVLFCLATGLCIITLAFLSVSYIAASLV